MCCELTYVTVSNLIQDVKDGVSCLLDALCHVALHHVDPRHQHLSAPTTARRSQEQLESASLHRCERVY